ncbi:MAG TPA: hypothetical protein VGX50_04470 [Longimicrobium sp.]|jgi:hypothetical protein|nr:hypothetical protein [Longimicrobium sp.]
MSRRFTLMSLLAASGSLGVLAPVSLTSTAGVQPAAAECATCCSQPGATCVVCGTEACTALSGYYEGKIGPGGCETQQT